MYPIKLIPAYKEYLWGGENLKKLYNKKSPYAVTAESWELSTHKDGESVAANGEYAGEPLARILARWGAAAVGEGYQPQSGDVDLPILIKLLDANDNLSIQVHPGDEYAMANEGDRGKTELWYITEAAPDAAVYFGFNRELTKKEFAAAIADNKLPELLNRVPCKKGQHFLVKAGTVHALCKGAVVAEIQQSSNVTYRVYDYDRKVNGVLRQLHIDKALDVSELCTPDEGASGYSPDYVQSESSSALLAKTQYFTVNRVDISGSQTLTATAKSFHSLIFVEGEGELSYQGSSIPFTAGDTFFVPAGIGEYSIVGDCRVLLSTL